MGVQHMPDVLEIERKSFADPWTHTMFLHQLKDPLSINCIAQIHCGNAAIVLGGYVCGIVVHDESMLYRIACRTEYRRRGIATKLLYGFLSEAIRRGSTNCYLEVGALNSAAQQFYQHHGFSVMGRRPRYYPEQNQDALIMMLHLTDAHEHTFFRTARES